MSVPVRSLTPIPSMLSCPTTPTPSRTVQANMLLFSDTACSGDKLIGSEVYGMGCAMRVQDSYYSTDSAYSTSLQCVPQSSDPAQRYIPPSPSTDASYAVQRYSTVRT